MLIDQFYAKTKSIAFDVGYLREHARNIFLLYCEHDVNLINFCMQHLFKDICVKIIFVKILELSIRN